MSAYGLRGWINILSAICAIAAAVLWIISARVEVWVDGQAGVSAERLVIIKDGRKFDVTGTAQAQSDWSSYAAFAAAAAAALQALSAFLKD
jgi:hypothetical protein